MGKKTIRQTTTRIRKYQPNTETPLLGRRRLSITSNTSAVVGQPKSTSILGISSSAAGKAVAPNRFHPLRPSPRGRRRNQATLSAPPTTTTTSSSSSTRSNQMNPESWHDLLAQFFRRQRTIMVPRWVTPVHQTISISEIFGHSSFVLVAFSYAVDDFLTLRCIAVVGSTAMLFFTYFHPHGRVLWLPFKWNVLFIALNSYRVGKALIQRKWAEHLGKDFIALRDEHFHLMDPVDYAKLIRLGKVESYPKGSVIVEQGQDNHHVRLVLDGELEVQRDGKMTYLMNEANFVSESGLHAGLMLPGSINSCCTVMARTDAKVLAWERDELLHLMERDKGVHQSLQNAMSWDIVRKLKTQRFISSNLIENQEQWTERRKEQTQHRYTAILQNLLQHPRLLNCKDTRVRLHNYRVIHHIDDEHHEDALKTCGWSLSEFEQGYKHGAASHKTDFFYDEKNAEVDNKSWRWYLQDIYLRFFG